jgi:hypothetical protein
MHLDFVGNIWVNRPMQINCDYCGDTFERSNGRYNEAIKYNWRQFCSLACQTKAKEKQIEFTCAWKTCGKKCSRIVSEAVKSNKLFCSIQCSAKHYGSKVHNEHAHVCKLAGCNNLVSNIDNRKKYCSPQCLKKYQKLSSYTKRSVITAIREFYLQNGRIPLKYELGAIYAPARRFFGTWNSAIEAAGYDPNPVMFAKHYQAKDGHKCDSMAEKIVDDWLYARKIGHLVHVPYPWHNGMKCDFLVGDTWVEIFGLEGNLKRYDELKKEKLELIKTYNLKTIRLSLKEAYSSRKLYAKLSGIIKLS